MSNPIVTIEMEGLRQVKVYSVDGRLVKTISVSGSSCQIEGLDRGVYLLRIETRKRMAVRKIVKL